MFERIRNLLDGNFHVDTTSATLNQDIIRTQFNNPLDRILYVLPVQAQLYVIDHLPSRFPKKWIDGYYKAKLTERVFKFRPEDPLIVEDKSEARLRQLLMVEGF